MLFPSLKIIEADLIQNPIPHSCSAGAFFLVTVSDSSSIASVPGNKNTKKQTMIRSKNIA